MTREDNPKNAGRRWSRIATVLAGACVLAAAPGSIAQALAAGPPSVTTGSAQKVAYASADVTATVNPAGASTTYHFEYGTSTAYGTQTSTASAGSGSASVAVSATLTGLAPSTTYHFRIVANNASGTVHGNDASFATSATPAPVVSTAAASALAGGSATLNGTVNPQGVPTTYYYEYGTTPGYGAKTAVTSAGTGTAAVAVPVNISGLSPSTTYHYRLVAASSGGTVVGSDLSFATTKLPAALVATGAASAVTTTTASLSATVNPEGLATNYYFQYGTSTGYGHTSSTHSAGSASASAALTQSISGLAAGTTYHYRVVATSAGGTVTGKDATFATARAPSVVTGTPSTVGTTSATLTGTVDPLGAATTYHFQYGTKTPVTSTSAVSAGSGSANVAVRATISGLVPGTTYVYRLVAVGAATTDGATRSFTTAKIAPALSLHASSNPVAAGSTVTFTGTLSGTGVGVRSVALAVEPYPYRGGFQQVGSAVSTSATGAFSFALANLNASTRVRVVTIGGSPALTSATILERARVRVNVHLRRPGGAARFYGLLGPAGAPVRIQIQRRVHGHWVTVARTATHPVSSGLAAYSYTIRHPHRGGRYRVVARVRDGSLLWGYTRVLTVH